MTFFSRYSVFSLLVICMVLSSCVRPKSEFASIPSGPWRGVLLLDREPVITYGDDRDIKKKFDFDSELPFQFEIGVTDTDSMFVDFYNGEEKIRITDVTCGKATMSSKDTIRINFLAYDTYIQAIYEDGVMEGNWVVNYKENYMIPFKAVFGQNHRFVHKNEKAGFKPEGRWNCTFEPGKEDEFPAIGDFTSDGNEVSGTFLTETGDFRYLHGNIIDNKMYLSAFDGAHAFLIQAKFTHADSLFGSFRSGKHYTAEWLGHRNENVTLKDPASITKIVSTKPLSFSFPNQDGKLVSINDEVYKNKIKLIQIMGSWCPNCYDEVNSLKSFLNDSNQKDISWISLAYERYDDKDKVLSVLRNYKTKMSLGHEILWAGSYKKEEASRTISQISEISSFPTLLVVDKNNVIRHVHTGFSGPATKEYKKFEAELKSIIQKLKNES